MRTKSFGNDRLNIEVEGRGMEEMNAFSYLGVDISADGSIKNEVTHRIDEGKRVGGVSRHL